MRKIRLWPILATLILRYQIRPCVVTGESFALFQSCLLQIVPQSLSGTESITGLHHAAIARSYVIGNPAHTNSNTSIRNAQWFLLGPRWPILVPEVARASFIYHSIPKNISGSIPAPDLTLPQM